MKDYEISFEVFWKANPDLSEFKAERVWRNAVSNAEEIGLFVPSEVLDELMRRAPGLTPNRLASDDLLVSRYKMEIHKALHFAIYCKEQEHLKQTKVWQSKRVRINELRYKEVYEQLVKLHEELVALREEQNDITKLDKLGGPLSLSYVSRIREIALAAHPRRELISL